LKSLATTSALEDDVLLSISKPTTRLTRRSLLISVGSAVAILSAPSAPLRVGALAAQTPEAHAGTFFDPFVVHDVTATFDQADYEAVIAVYQETGEKEWLSATVTIDGQTFEQVGLRLKGNSSLMGLRANSDSPRGDNGQAPPANVTLVTPDGTPVPSNRSPASEGADMMMGAPSGPNLVTAEEPELLPWLVRLDRNIDGQNFNGTREFVIRSNHAETALNEALALELLAEAGLASQAATYVRFSTNGSESRLRIAIENPDDIWLAKHFSPEGTLFKAEAEGDWTYRDDNWESYTKSFDLEAGGGDDDSENYAPLIAFLDFLNNSDDATFISDLPAWLDTEKFAVYMAMMDLIQNGDSIEGPGNNSYLYYDPNSSIFTVVPWDMNLAFGGMMGGGFRLTPGALGEAGSGGPPMVMNGTGPSGEPPVPPEDEFTPDGVPGGHGGDGRGGVNNPLVRRWKADAAFAAMQSEAENRLRAELFESGNAANILARWASMLETHAADLVDQATIEREVQQLQELIDAA
jgi:spore coat protein CotH